MSTGIQDPPATAGLFGNGFFGLEPMAHSPPLEARTGLYCVAAYLVPVIVQFGLPAYPDRYNELAWLTMLVPAFLLSVSYGSRGAAFSIVVGSVLFIGAEIIEAMFFIPGYWRISVPIYIAYGGLAISVGWISQRLHDHYRGALSARAHLSEARARELEIGAAIQDMFLHGKPPKKLEGVEINFATVPSQLMDGDFVDFFSHGDRYLDVLVGDVMGKGIPAALLGAATKSQFARSLGTLMSQSGGGVLPSPSQVVNTVHREVSARLLSLESFATASYLRFDLIEKRVTFVDCGHPKIVHYRLRNGSCQTLEGPDVPLGFQETHEYTETSIPFEGGDVFVIYSDGLTEARNSDGEMFGEERLLDVVTLKGAGGADVVAAALDAAVKDFCGARSLEDDLTLVTIGPGTSLADRDSEEIIVRRSLPELDSIRSLVGKVVGTRGEHDESNWVGDFKLALQEAVTNVVRHSGRGEDVCPIRVRVERNGDYLSCFVFYQGVEFDGGNPQAPVMEDLPEGGFGLFLMSRLCDVVRHVRSVDGTNYVQLIKRKPVETEVSYVGSQGTD